LNFREKSKQISRQYILAFSGDKTNLKVGGGGTSLAQKWEGHQAGAKRRKYSFLVAPLQFFGSKRTISRFGEHFRDGQYSLVSFLLAVILLTVPPYPAIVKVGSTCPSPCPVESAPLLAFQCKRRFRWRRALGSNPRRWLPPAASASGSASAPDPRPSL